MRAGGKLVRQAAILAVTAMLPLGACASQADAVDFEAIWVEPGWFAQYRQDLEEHALLYTACFAEHGIETTIGGTGLPEFPVLDLLDPASEALGALFTYAGYDCFHRYGMLSWWSMPVDAQAYQRIIDSRSCLVALGYDVPEAPPLEIWLEMDGDWNPHGELYDFRPLQPGGRGWTEGEWFFINERCPQPGPVPFHVGGLPQGDFTLPVPASAEVVNALEDQARRIEEAMWSQAQDQAQQVDPGALPPVPETPDQCDWSQPFALPTQEAQEHILGSSLLVRNHWDVGTGFVVDGYDNSVWCGIMYGRRWVGDSLVVVPMHEIHWWFAADELAHIKDSALWDDIQLVLWSNPRSIDEMSYIQAGIRLGDSGPPDVILHGRLGWIDDQPVVIHPQASPRFSSAWFEYDRYVPVFEFTESPGGQQLQALIG